MKYTLLILLFISSCTGGIQEKEPISTFEVHRGQVKEIIIELNSYELGDEWIELSLYRDGIFQSSDRQFNTAEFSEAQKLTYKLTTDGKEGTYKVVSDKPFIGVILNIKKVR
jgi:hypothetical protein